MNPKVQKVLAVLEHGIGDVEANVNMPALEKTVGDTEKALVSGESVILAVINDAPAIFPNAAYLPKAVKLLDAVAAVAHLFGVTLPEQAPASA